MLGEKICLDYLVFLYTSLALSDYYLIPCLKRDLGGQHVAMEEDLQSAVAEFLAKQDAEWYNGIHKFISRYNKCLISRVIM